MTLMNMPRVPNVLAMSGDMSTAFKAGSGVSPDTLHSVIFAICAGVALVICAWVGVKLIEALRDGDIASSDALRGIVSTIILAGTLLWVVS